MDPATNALGAVNMAPLPDLPERSNNESITESQSNDTHHDVPTDHDEAYGFEAHEDHTVPQAININNEEAVDHEEASTLESNQPDHIEAAMNLEVSSTSSSCRALLRDFDQRGIGR